MSHLHFPDGILPIWLWLSGYIIVLLFIFTAVILKKNTFSTKKYVLAGVMAALMLVVMSIELPIGYHINLASLSGILLGPFLSFFTVFITNIFLSLLGHGGLSVIGLNTIIVYIEALAGYSIYKALSKNIKQPFKKAFIATLAGLFISTSAMVAVVYSGTRNLPEVHDHHAHSIEHTEDSHHEHEHHQEEFDIKRFLVLILTLGLAGWLIESTITAFIVNYISKTKPEILEQYENS